MALLGLLLCPLSGSASPDIRDVTLTIGEDWGVIRELRGVHLERGVQALEFDFVPAEADLTSLLVRHRRTPVEIISWEWVGDGAGSSSDAVAHGLTVPGDGSVTWEPGGPPSEVPEHASGLRTVRCVLRSAVSGPRTIELIYRIRGVTWKAHYQVVVMGELGDAAGRVAASVRGIVRVSNGTSRTFSNALVRLVGPDRLPQREKRRTPGFLHLDPESPLADMWRQADPEANPEYVYRLPQRIDVHAQDETEAPFVDAGRAPALKLYSIASEDVPLSDRERTWPLTEMILLENTAEAGLGWVLPPGPVDLFLGGTRRHLLPGGHIPYTPLGEEIRIDLGEAPGVLGRRRSRGRIGIAQGLWEDTYEIVLVNHQSTPVTVEIDEKPPPALEWTVLSSTEPYEERDRRLIFRPRVPANGEHAVEYRLRVYRPTR